MSTSITLVQGRARHASGARRSLRRSARDVARFLRRHRRDVRFALLAALLLGFAAWSLADPRWFDLFGFGRGF